MANDKKKPSIASQGAVMRRVLRYICLLYTSRGV